MNRYILRFTVFVAALFVNDVDVAVAVNWSGSMSGTKNLTETVNITGTVTIEKGKTLTIQPSGANRIIRPSTSLGNNPMFKIEDGGTLIITKSGSYTITINGRTTFNGNAGNGTNHPFTVNGSTVTLATRSTTYKMSEAIQNNNGTLTLENVTIQNIYGTGSGGAILIDGTTSNNTRITTIKYCTIRNCVSEQGSAIQITNDNKNNTGNAEKCKLVVENSVIEWNYSWGEFNEDASGTGSGSGGTIRTNGNCVSNLYFTNVIVRNNYSGGAGGGIYWNGAGTTSTCCNFNGCTFENNIARGNGGGMMLETTFKFDPNGNKTIIRNNKSLSANGTGGGIVVTSYGGNSLNVVSGGKYVFNYDLTDKLEITGNEASAGGGIAFNFQKYQLNADWNNNDKASYSVTANINFKGAIIKGNTATAGVGGGIRLYNNTAGNNGKRTVQINVYLNNGTLSENKAVTYGGGLYTYKANVDNNATGGLLTISDNVLTGNNNSKGGGIYVDGGTSIQLGETYISGNSANHGGALAIAESGSENLSVSLGTSTIVNNHVTNKGGAIYLPTGTLNITNPTIQNNYANNGGAVYLEGGNLKTTGTATVSGNYAKNNGGAFWVKDGTVSMVSPTLSGNGMNNGTATTANGGAIYVTGTGAGFTATGSTSITNNASTIAGGAIYVNGGNISMATNTISGNSSANGGAIYLTGGNLKTTGTATVSNNYATSNGNGGAFYVDGGTVSMENPTLRSNGMNNGTATTANGGAIYVTGTGAGFTATGTTSITNNASTTAGGAIYVDGGNISMVSNTISENSSANGGAIYAKGNVTITGNSTMNQNTATTNGGVAYVNGGNITVSGNNTELTLSQNSAQNGGAFYVNKGNITTTGINKSTIKDNYTTGDGGAFYVNEGNITLAKTELTGNGYNSGSVSTTNGGAIALYNGVFTFADGSEIKNNAASGNGGALYINNTSDAKSITCTGGSYIGNQATLGGGIYAAGNIQLTFGADVLNNTAKNGGGLYLDLTKPSEATKYSMTVTHGLIVGNKAEGENTEGVGGGIYLKQGSLKFTNPQNFGTYNNAASYEAADIYASGDNTTIYLPHPDLMQLSGFDIPGSALYWVYDAHENDINNVIYGRYEEMLLAMDPERPIQDMMLSFGSTATEAEKTVTGTICLDLGYDLVYVTLNVAGLQGNDAAAINMIYYHKTKKEYIVYRKALYQATGELTKVIGLPSGYWIFEATEWSDDKYAETYSPAHDKTNPDDTETTPKKYISIKNDGSDGGVRAVSVTFATTKNDNNANTKYVKSYSTMKVNVM